MKPVDAVPGFVAAVAATTPRLLVSVRSLHEAREALAGGADIVDIKEPSRGSLGRADIRVLHEIADDDELYRRAPITAALGDLRDYADLQLATAGLPSALSLAKIGFAGERSRHDWPARFSRVIEARRGHISILPVAYADADRADSPPVGDIVQLAIRTGSPFVLIDTYVKDGRGFWDWLDAETWCQFWKQCRASSVAIAVAGALRAGDLEQFVECPPSVIAVRGAACAAGLRTADIAQDAVARFQQMLKQKFSNNREGALRHSPGCGRRL